eukprot:COSAG01_NODE_714_length_14097_cov_6.044435_16_plen_60_part_00
MACRRPAVLLLEGTAATVATTITPPRVHRRGYDHCHASTCANDTLYVDNMMNEVSCHVA